MPRLWDLDKRDCSTVQVFRRETVPASLGLGFGSLWVIQRPIGKSVEPQTAMGQEF